MLWGYSISRRESLKKYCNSHFCMTVYITCWYLLPNWPSSVLAGYYKIQKHQHSPWPIFQGHHIDSNDLEYFFKVMDVLSFELLELRNGIHHSLRVLSNPKKWWNWHWWPWHDFKVIRTPRAVLWVAVSVYREAFLGSAPVDQIMGTIVSLQRFCWTHKLLVMIFDTHDI